MPRHLSDHKFPTKKRPSVSKNPFNPDGLLRRLSFRTDSALFDGPRAQAEKLNKRRSLYDREMPNSTNGVRGGPSKRSDQKKNLESSSFDSQDPSRRDLEELRNSIDVIGNCSMAINRVADIAKLFISSSFARDLQTIEDEFGAEIAKENTIRELKQTIESLAHVKSEETKKLQQDYERLTDEQVKCQRETEKALDMQKKVEGQLALAEASMKKESEHKLQDERTKLQKSVKLKKAELEDEYSRKFQDLDEKCVKLSATNAELEKRCSKADQTLKVLQKRFERDQENLEDRNDKLNEALKQWEAQFPVKGEPVEYYTQQFRQIYDSIKGLSSKYFQKLPEEATTNPDVIHEELCELDSVFGPTPIWQSPVSDYLRMRNVEHIISSCLCATIWQPFSPQNGLAANNQTLSPFLSSISASLSASDARSEGIWRVLTLRAINTLPDSIPAKTRIESTVQSILKILRPLTAPRDAADLTTDLQSLITASSTLWATTRTDPATITLSTQPSSSDPSAWQALDMDPTTTPPPSHPSASTPTTPPLLLFPHIQHSQPPPTNPTAKQSPLPPTTLHPGMTLFPTSRACTEGLIEQKQHKEEMEQAVLAAKCKVRARRASGSFGASGKVGMGMGMGAKG